MKRLLITAIIAAGLLYSGPALAATTLSDTELAGVSGGGIDPHLEGQSLPQEQQQPQQQQQPEKNNTGYTPFRQPQSFDGMELAPELFAILQSRIDVERERRLLLNGTAQQNATALNLENALSSDVVSTDNIFNGGSITIDDVTTNIEINQINNVNQLHRTQGSLTSSIAGHRYEKSELRRSGFENYEYHDYSFVEQDSTEEFISTKTRFDKVKVGVTYESPTLKELQKDGFIPSNTVRIGLDLLNFKVHELNYGTGFQIKGSIFPSDPVSIPGFFKLEAEAMIDIKILWWTLHLELDLIDIDNKLNLDIDTVLGDLGNTDIETETEENLVTKQKAIDIAESTYSESYEQSVFTGGQMTGAEAELLALSDGSLSVDNNSTVALSDNTQQNMRVFNGVNAVSSIAANSLNMGRTSSFSARPTGAPQLSLQQHNRFNQEM
ncbi:MAG: hypothetical protein GY807_10210 [Gammaproteobacteria bacterium]|nr:hypothetical protein [Gammaproteobacteria bacterium]